ncbi:glycosyltransferase family 2 protein [Frankia sp. Cr2]|uniref:glycosyltransferase family 2 protein n=1 Tax=Frankia sp. Cr2 TaxID=3073932 RepID=UPI002AD3C0BC|nr:glycosyltransferase family 2 protein [Frankia sp. Cr2]
MSTQEGGPAPLATVVIVNWNGAHLLPACLDAIAKQVSDFTFETWVVDNASMDSSRTLLAERYPWVRMVPSEVNLGFAGGNNLALRMVTTPYAVLLNNDAVPEPDWLANLLAPFAADRSGGEQPSAVTGRPSAITEKLGAVTGKVVFLPRFLRLRLSTTTFTPGAHDSRALGVRISSVTVNDREILHEVLWEKLTFGAEGGSSAPFFWTRGDGELAVPVPEGGPVTIGFTWSGEAPKSVTLSWDAIANSDAGGDTGGGSSTLAAGAEPSTVELTVPDGVARVDVINNVGGIVLRDGYGADRGYQQIDTGQFAGSEDVFTACGNGMAIRTALGRELGWFDDDFFLYYEDTDLSWRIRSHGYTIRYVPTAVLRHVHSASSVEWSPLFVFHTDRNRLLMLTKNASTGLALAAVGRYPLTTASMAIRAIRQAWAVRGRPALRPTVLRLKVMASYLRLLPVMLGRRRALARTASVGHRELEIWLAQR